MESTSDAEQGVQAPQPEQGYCTAFRACVQLNIANSSNVGERVYRPLSLNSDTVLSWILLMPSNV
jgi:hypothetical protein